jgi:hypothetical protein
MKRDADHWWKHTVKGTQEHSENLCLQKTVNRLASDWTQVFAGKVRRVTAWDITSSIKINIIISFLYLFNSYRAVNTVRLGYKTNQLMLYSEIIADCSQIHIKHINTLCGKTYRAVNTHRLDYKNRSVNAVQGNNRCSEIHKNYEHIVWAEK